MTRVKVFDIFRLCSTWFLMNAFVTKNNKKSNDKANKSAIFNKKRALS